ncbi:hypothetical protein EJ05DRAFT_534401 [Pseudovirgaria hyperparasitica]|uniref:Nudix hydrolase domain-containing protein n=1 Tax=Pseudovirgaria hyperparasitica TaxID=470096 RepID=A0A6A6WLA3_9PEZI|nr:uncharacterized protein EJ05DRAFT_534401 [Pseudovirgaria hyperparasitica]KAF2762953.1 hypothetical protein EJ05DRAFT_534401 [Pseudovirgaria hyperparasitica]
MANIPFPHPFTTTPATTPFHIPKTDWLAANPRFANLAIGAVVFSPPLPQSPNQTTTTTTPKILLLQRAAHEAYANTWEPPGGGCEDATIDRTLLHGVGRELWEEAGLVMTRVMARVGGVHAWSHKVKGQWAKIVFWVEVERGADGDGNGNGNGNGEGDVVVRLDPKEHQAFVWASEEEVLAGRVGGVEVGFMEGAREMFVDAFRVRREAVAALGEGGAGFAEGGEDGGVGVAV